MSFNQLVYSGIDALLGARSWTGDSFIACLLDNTYTFNSSHTNRSSMTSAIVSTVSLGTRTISNGVLSLSTPTLTFSSVTSSNPVQGFGVFYDSGTASTDTFIGIILGKLGIQIAATTSSSTTVPIFSDSLLADLPNGTVLTKISGSGPTTITLGASASAGAGTLTANSSVSVNRGDIYAASYLNSGLPTSGSISGNVTVAIPTGGLFQFPRLGS